jgi:hypothetical protein
MKSIGKKPSGLRLERIQSAKLWTGESFRNLHPVTPGLRDTSAKFPSMRDFLFGGPRRRPRSNCPLWTRVSIG